MKHSQQHKTQFRSRGVTLVELLVVVSILLVITAIMIPRLRVINKDRNIREAARVVGSTLAKSSNRAINDGIAGLIIERNDNFVDANGVYYAATRMYQMRKLPPFSGDDLGSLAEVTGSSTNVMNVEIPIPLEYTSSNPMIRNGDEIRLNHNSVRYQIINVATSSGKLQLDVQLGLSGSSVRPTLPLTTSPDGYPYVIYRQPRKLESSRVDLPDGYYIDLRLSGPLVPAPTAAPVPPDWERGSVLDDVTFAGDTVQFVFNRQGSIKWYSYSTFLGGPGEIGTPTDSFYFYVTSYDPELIPDAFQALQEPSAMWVTIDNATGSVNVAYNAPPPTSLTTLNGQAQSARQIGKTRESANQ